MRKKLLLVAAFNFLASCGVITKEEFDKKSAMLESRIAQLEERQRLLEERNIKTEGRVDNLSETLAGIRLDIERLKLDRSQPQEISTKLPEPKKEVPIAQRDLQTTPSSAPGSTEDFQKEYEEALNLYDLKQLHQAKDKFIDFIKKHPKTPLTDNAYLWLGVIYRDLGELNKAEAVWLTLVERCQRKEMIDCNKAPSALLQLARLYEQRGDVQKAKEFYETILRAYPSSEEANTAKTKLGR
ncbi:MAG: tetratricopeptide repeat protein [Aquificaceae bacterium]